MTAINNRHERKLEPISLEEYEAGRAKPSGPQRLVDEESMRMFEEAIAREDGVDTRDTDTFTAHMEESYEEEEGPSEEAVFWAEKYNADKSVPMEERTAAFTEKQSVKVLKKTTKAIESAVASGAFEVEMKSRGLTGEAVVAALENISKVETSGGRNNTISKGMAGGVLQVIPRTFKDLLNRGVVGPKALKALKKTKEELLAMSDQESAEYLRDNDKAGAMFGLAAYLNKTERVEGHQYLSLNDGVYEDPDTGGRFEVKGGRRL